MPFGIATVALTLSIVHSGHRRHVRTCTKKYRDQDKLNCLGLRSLKWFHGGMAMDIMGQVNRTNEDYTIAKISYAQYHMHNIAIII